MDIKLHTAMHSTRRNIRPNYPLSSAMINDIFTEYIKDLESIISFSLDMTTLKDSLKSTLDSVNNIIRKYELYHKSSQLGEEYDSYTTNWREL